MIPWYGWACLALGAASAVTCGAIIAYVVVVEARDNRHRTVGDQEVEMLDQLLNLPTAPDGPPMRTPASRRRRGF